MSYLSVKAKRAIYGLLTAILLVTAAGAVFAASDQEKKTDPEKVLARVEGQEIKEKDVEQILEMMGPQGTMMYNNPEGRKAILDELVSMRLFALKGAKDGLDKTPEFQASLENFKAQALARASIESSLSKIAVTDEEAKKYYDEHKDQFTEPEQVHVRHILLSDDVTSADSIKKVQEALKSGTSFDEAAKTASLCPSAPEGGDLGFISKGQMVPEFEEAAFALKKPGDLSEPVKTRFGWHIIKLEEKKAASVHAFNEVKPQILQILANEKKANEYKTLFEGLKKQYKVEMIESVSEDVKAVSGDKK